MSRPVAPSMATAPAPRATVNPTSKSPSTAKSHTAVRVPRSGPLTPAHRMHLRALLHELWCQHLDELTSLSIAAHAERAGDTEELDTRLWSLRRALVEIEAAIRRIDTRGYGRCDGCDGWIETAMLQRRPHRRFCARCERRAAA